MDFIDILILLIIVYLITSLLGYYMKRDDIENFQSIGTISTKDHYKDIYDKFYSNIYDSLFNSGFRSQFEIMMIKKYALDIYKPQSEINILDVGCGTGAHVKMLDKKKYKCSGLDVSSKMINVSRKNNPGINFKLGDMHTNKLFKNREFSHILCLFFTIYYSDNPNKIFQNFNYWLKPKGYLCVHLVYPKDFDPVLEKSSALIPLFNPQRHSKKRVTKTSLTYNNFKYISDWEFKGNKVKFVENFIFKKDPRTRRNVHQLNMYSVKKYIKIARKNGFKLIKIIDLTPANHEFNNIYIFQKIYGD